MIFQEIDFLRFFSIFIGQGVLALIFLLIAIRILGRNRSRLSLIISSFYILESIAFVLNIIYFPIKINPLASILYLATIYLISFAPILLVLFSITLYRSEKAVKSKAYQKYIIMYGIVLFILLIIPGSFEFGENTGWRPQLSWFLLIGLYSLVTIGVLIPMIKLMKRISAHFNDKKLRKKWNYFQYGFYGIAISYYGLVLYSTWRNPIFQIIYPIFTILLIPAGYLLYLGLGKKI